MHTHKHTLTDTQRNCSWQPRQRKQDFCIMNYLPKDKREKPSHTADEWLPLVCYVCSQRKSSLDKVKNKGLGI